MPGKGKQHASSLDDDQTHNRTEDHAASHLGNTSGTQKKKLGAGKKAKESHYQARPETTGGESTQQQQKNHQCKICDRCFKYSSHLKPHILMHTGEKPHKCKVCDKCF